MYSVEGNNSCWNGFDDYCSFNDFYASDFSWTSPSASGKPGVSLTSNASVEKGVKRSREKKSSSQSESKSNRERLRREKMNDRFSELCSFLHPGGANKADKSTAIGDAICALTKLQCELQELKVRKTKLQDHIRNLKAEKNELREEKVQLKARKEKIELEMKTTTGFMPAVCENGGNKLMGVSIFGGFPMWQWICPALLDTSQDHVLRPPVA